MAQGVKADRLANPGRLLRYDEGPLDHGCVQGSLRRVAREQPSPRFALFPIGAETFQERRRKHDVPIHFSLALLDPDQHFLTVDVGQLQVEHFVQAQPGRVRDLIATRSRRPGTAANSRPTSSGVSVTGTRCGARW